MSNQETNTAHSQADAQLASIVEMVAALDCDYDRLQELRDERAALVDEVEESAACVRHHHNDADPATINPEEYPEAGEWHERTTELTAWDEDNADELADLEEAAGDCEDEDDARSRIEDDALSVEVRSEWHWPGGDSSPAEFRIVLCSGGPHVEIVGDLSEHGEPTRARLLYQDWGTSKQEYIGSSEDIAALLAYAACFYYG